MNEKRKLLYEKILEILREKPYSIRQLHKILLKERSLEIKNPMFLSGYLKAMEDLNLPIGHTESGGAIFYYFKHKGTENE